MKNNNRQGYINRLETDNDALIEEIYELKKKISILDYILTIYTRQNGLDIPVPKELRPDSEFPF